MIDYITGRVVELNPAEVILENNGIGYSISISLQTFKDLQINETAKVYIHHYLREDCEEYYGFSTREERAIFNLIIGVSGIGVSTARMMLSSMSSDELCEAIITENVNKIKSVKGIGLKSAQRVILELKDKIDKESISNPTPLISTNQEAEEAIRALVTLGFTKQNVQKIVQDILKKEPDSNIEYIIKMALRSL